MPYLYVIIACSVCLGIGFFIGMLYQHAVGGAMVYVPEPKKSLEDTDFEDFTEDFEDNFIEGTDGHVRFRKIANPYGPYGRIGVNATYGKNGTLEKVISNIQEHDVLYPNHGIGCSCHDVHAGKIRLLYKGINDKSRRNLMVVLGYVTRSP